MAGHSTPLATPPQPSHKPARRLDASHALSKPQARRTGWLRYTVDILRSAKSFPLKHEDLSHLRTLEPPPAVRGYAFIYILVCTGGALYVGSATDLAARLQQHDGTNGAKFTRDHPGGRLVYFEGPFPTVAALRRERQLKRWSRAKKLALIQNQAAVLIRLSQSRERNR